MKIKTVPTCCYINIPWYSFHIQRFHLSLYFNNQHYCHYSEIGNTVEYCWRNFVSSLDDSTCCLSRLHCTMANEGKHRHGILNITTNDETWGLVFPSILENGISVKCYIGKTLAMGYKLFGTIFKTLLSRILKEFAIRFQIVVSLLTDDSAFSYSNSCCCTQAETQLVAINELK